MYLLDPATTERYLRDRGELAAGETVRVSELSGGVSNQVLLVERGRGDRFVLKQAREQLRVEQEWKCDVRRIWREMDVLRICGEVLRKREMAPTPVTVCVPEILFEDYENFCYAMTAAPEGHRTWKQCLMTGHVEHELVVAAGRLLGQLHGGTWHDNRIRFSLADRIYFDALRIDPYYRRIAEVHPDLRPEINALIDSGSNHCDCLTYGDFSPKNLLVANDKMVLIDFEVGHYGDPAFDVGFCMTHLVLKSIWAGPKYGDYLKAAEDFWYAYALRLGLLIEGPNAGKLQQRCVANLAGCLLARVDGKSPVDYLNESQRAKVRELASLLFKEPVAQMSDAIQSVPRIVRLP